MQHIHHDIQTKTSLKNQRKISLNPFSRRLPKAYFFASVHFAPLPSRANGRFLGYTLTLPMWVFCRKAHAEPLLEGFPKLEEKIRSLEPSGKTSSILVVLDMVELSRLSLFILSSWDFPLRCVPSSLFCGSLTPYPFL